MKADSDPSNSTPVNLTKQMLEIKKKIQLSEGQRKAAFEDCEAERKSNIEEIHKLKKEIREFVKEVKDKTQQTAALKNSCKKIEQIIGPCEDKSVEEIKKLLNLQIIDKSKALNLIIYRVKKQQEFLAQLGKEYQNLISEKLSKEVVEKVDRPSKKQATCDLQNSIHAVEIQLREANHISLRYKHIKNNLMRDAARFQSNINKIEEDLDQQKNDIQQLQQVMNEATQKRGAARGHLLHEEKLATAKAHSRDRQTAEGQRLVTKRRQELELLEKRIFQVARIQRPAGGGGGEDGQDDEVVETPSPPEDQVSRAFEILKKATGATNSEEVVDKFNGQKDTLERLILLRKQAEEEKKKLENELQTFSDQLEFYKFAEVKNEEKKSSKIDLIQAQIHQAMQKSQKLNEIKAMKEKTSTIILRSIQDLHLCTNPLAIPEDKILSIIDKIKSNLEIIFDKFKMEEILEDKTMPTETLEEKWLPAPYGGLVRRTPLPQPGASPAPPPPPGSEDEEEVPSRTYLKRQAQLVVDAKLRRKNVRIPQKRN